MTGRFIALKIFLIDLLEVYLTGTTTCRPLDTKLEEAIIAMVKQLGDTAGQADELQPFFALYIQCILCRKESQRVMPNLSERFVRHLGRNPERPYVHAESNH